VPEAFVAVDLHSIRYLIAIAEEGSFARAAEKLGMTQPALSKSVRALERSLGVKLLDRGRYGARPTSYGLALARHAQSIDAELNVARSEIAAMRTGRAGSVCIGCGPSEATRLLPIALTRLRARVPDLQVSVLYGLNEALMPMVRHGEVDLALSSIPPRASDPDLRHVQVHTDRATVVVRQGHPLLAKPRELEAHHILDCDWILPRSQELERRALDELFVQAGLTPPKAAIETTSAVLMKTVVMQSDFLTFLPRELIFWEERTRLLVPLRVDGPPWRRHVGVTLRARGSASPAVAALIDELRRAGRNFDASPTA
jgi:DNA-binding transcriptional LysR family regulator